MTSRTLSRKYFKLVKTESSSKQPEIAITSLQGNVKVELPPTSNNLHVKHEPLDKKPLKLEIPSPLKLEIPSPLKLEGIIHEDLLPLDVKDVVGVQESIISEDHYLPHASFDFGPFDDNWVLNYDFSQHSTPNNTTNYLFPYVTTPPDEDSKSVDSVESIGGLIRWANYNPWEDEMNTYSYYNPFEDEFSVFED
ncbi:hypothetical protein L1987_71491 [Smallanthus sonchifolius]|uniref:Uncharacterized protein n=1 Tax=Smallanthus sonchifolius TaxID=185202 RepID=A0ACB9AT77_9ASTR|nr:hypothetical protein L1987_71491 [Smallanthus sonchifolius]